MTRIPDETIDRIKREVSVADLVRRQGVELRGHGENLIGLCPFHDDHDPSLVVTPAKNLWNCLGACQRGGDVIRWVEVAEHVPFRRAIELLHRGYPDFNDASARTPRKSKEPLPECPISLEMSDREIVDRIISYYAARLRSPENVEAVAYLERRGIWNEEAVDHFRIGFADRSLGPLLPHPDYKAGKLIRQKLMDLGLYRADSGHEHFNGCVVFPIFGREKEVTEVYGRKIRDDVRHRVGWHLYLPGPHRGIWNRDALIDTKELIVCEAILDALTFWIHGHRNVIAAYGVNGFTEEMFEAVKACGIERVLIAYDRDEAGDKAAAQLGARLAGEGISANRVLFPRMMDANEYAKKVQPAAQALGILLRSAEWLAGPKTVAAPKLAPAPAVVVRHPRAAELPEPPPPVAKGPVTTQEEPILSLAAAAAEEPAAAEPPAADFSSIDITLGDRQYRIRGLEKNLSYAQLKVVIRVGRGETVFLDQVDLVSARHRAQFVRQAATDIGVKEEVIKHDLGAVYRELEILQEKLIKGVLEPKEKRPAMREDEVSEALDLLRDPKLLERVLDDYERCGVVGERTNKLVAFIAAASRLLDEPLAIIIQSSSAAGKTKLMDAVLDFMPEEERIRYSAMTGQSLFYFEGSNLKHKILAISEEEGAERAAYALKLLQSEGQLTIASTGKDPHTGRLVTQEYRVEGPVMIFLTSTSVEIDEELLNRCIVLTVDEEREQTRAIHRLQRAAETLEGMLAREERGHIFRLQRNAQRLLRPVRVVNPYAPSLTFLDGRTRTRRDHTKYLTLIRTIALLHQHQRPRKTFAHRGKPIEYIEVTPSDIALANELAHEVLGRSLDELAPQTRRLIELLDANVTRECMVRAMARSDLRFFQRDVREWTGWTDFQVKVHLRKLVEMEYLLIHRGGRGQSFVYELLYDGKGKNGKPFLPGLIEIDSLITTENRELRNDEWEQPGSGQGAAGEAGGSMVGGSENASADAASPRSRRYTLRNGHQDRGGNGASYPLVMTPAE